MRKIAFVAVLLLVVVVLPLVAHVQPSVAYYVNVHGYTYGPYSMSDLMHFINQGRVTRNSLIWRPGMNHWTAAGNLVELASLFSTPHFVVQPRASVPLFTSTPVTPYVLTPIAVPVVSQPYCACRQYTWGSPYYSCW